MSELYKKFGELLKLERKRKGIKLEELSEQLKITEANLEYIEEGQVASLPSMIYYNLFAKAYSEALGIDYSRTVDAIKEDLGESIENNIPGKEPAPAKDTASKAADKDRTEEKADESGVSIKKLLYIFGSIVVVFVLFIIGYLLFFAPGGSQTTPAVAAPDSSEVTSTRAATTDEEQMPAEIDWTVSKYDEPTKISLRLIPRQQSWSTVLADGDTAIFRNLQPGRIYDAEADYRMTVSVGIPSQVDIELNGQKVDLRDSETGRISRVEINQLNLEEILTRGIDTLSTPIISTPPAQSSQQNLPATDDSLNNIDSDKGDSDET